MEKNINKKYNIPKTIIFNNWPNIILNTCELEKIGIGHDGIVFRYDDQAIKINKNNLDILKEKNLMTFNKLLYFMKELSLKRIVNPSGAVHDENGVYTGYSMKFFKDITKNGSLPNYIKVGNFTCIQMIYSLMDLEEDFNELTKHRVAVRDINRGSYIFSEDFLHICDMDKFDILSDKSLGAENANKEALNFTIAKLLYYLMIAGKNLDKSQLRQLSNWIKKSANSRTFIKELSRELPNDNTPLSEYADVKVKKIML